MTDIVDRLRNVFPIGWEGEMRHEAADEIERLRAQLAQTRTVAAAAVKAARREGIEAAAKVAEWAHMVPPDGGSPTDAEYEIAKTAAQRIRALLRDHDIHHADQLANDILERLAAQGFVAVPVSTVTKEDSNERLWVEIVLLEATGVEAADEIERLRAEIVLLETTGAEAADEIERLRTALRSIVQGWDWWGVDQHNRCQSVPGDAIEEARALLTEGAR